jgi:hypothetical protein
VALPRRCGHFLPAPPFRPHSANHFFDAIARLNYPPASDFNSFTRFAKNMRGYTSKEKAKIAAGAVAALVIVAWLAIFALALLSA